MGTLFFLTQSVAATISRPSPAIAVIAFGTPAISHLSKNMPQDGSPPFWSTTGNDDPPAVEGVAAASVMEKSATAQQAALRKGILQLLGIFCPPDQS
jgi:hypothetical protein